MSAVQVTRGAVYDRGYRPYEGKRGRRGAATIALYKASVRRALGLRRSWRQKVAPFVLQVVLFVGNMFVSNSAQSYFTGHLAVLWKVPVAVFLLAIYYAVIGVAISSLSDRRIVAGASIIGLFLVTSIASSAIVGENY